MNRSDYVGQTLDGRYRIERLIGKGGMGSVFSARHIVIGKLVAVKFLHANHAEREEGVKRFFREAQAAARIGHKNIIDVLDVGVSAKGEPYLVMEYLDGENLAGLLKRSGPVDLATACGIIEPALLALSAAHEKRIVHRDLKPENIFLYLEDGELPTVKLIDFGISKFTGEGADARITKTGSPLGTPRYMSPEQIQGASDIDHRTDLYSVGVILYEMLTGELPFTGKFYNEVLIQVLTAEPRPPAEVNPEFATEAEALVLSLLSKQPADRPESALSVLASLAQFADFDRRNIRLTHYFEAAASAAVSSDEEPQTGQGLEKVHLATDVYAKLAGEKEPRQSPGGGEDPVLSRGKSRWRSISVAAAVLLLFGIAMLLLLPGTEEEVGSATEETVKTATSTPSSELEPDRTGVEIHISGIPDDAEIFYDGFKILENPFRVKTGGTIVQLRVTARGHRPYKVSIIPARDLELQVKMKPIVQPKKESAATATASADVEGIASSPRRKNAPKSAGETRKIRREKDRPKTTAPRNRSTKDFSRAGRGAVIAEDFE